MGCGCGKKETKDKTDSKKTEQSFTLITADGRTQTFSTQLEARAAQVRSGGKLK